MALDFYEINDTNRKSLLFQISNKQLDLINDVFWELKKLIGNTFDIYVSNRIYKSHAELLISIIKRKMNNTNDASQKQTLMYIITELSKVKEGFLAFGD